MSTKITNLLLLLILSFALLVRVYRLGQIPVSLYWDEAAIAYDAFSIVTTGHDMHGTTPLQPIFLSYGDFKAPMYIWLTALTMKLSGFHDWSVRLPSALAGIGIVFLSYLFSKKVFDSKRTGLLTAFIAAILPWDIYFSRTGFEAHIAAFFVFLSVYLWWKACTIPRWWLLSALTSAAAIYSYFSVRVVLPFLFFGFVVLFVKELKLHFWWILATVMLFISLLTPLYTSPYYAPSNTLRLSTPSLLNTHDNVLLSNTLRLETGNTIISRFLYHRYFIQIWLFLKNVSSFFDWKYLFFTGDPNLRHGIGTFGLLLPTFIFFFIAGFRQLIKKYCRLGLYLAYWWLIAVVPAAIPLTVPHALRSLNALPVLILIIGLGASQFKKNFLLILLVVSILFFGGFAHDYITHYPLKSANDWQETEKQLALSLINTSSSQTVMVTNPPSRWYLYVLWYGRILPSSIYQWQGAEPIAFDRYVQK